MHGIKNGGLAGGLGAAVLGLVADAGPDLAHLGGISEVIVGVVGPAGVGRVHAGHLVVVVEGVVQAEPVADLVHGRLALVHERVVAAVDGEGGDDAAVQGEPSGLVGRLLLREVRDGAGAAVVLARDVADVQVQRLVVAPVQRRLHLVEVGAVAGPARVDVPLGHVLAVVVELDPDPVRLVDVLDDLDLGVDFGFLLGTLSASNF